MCVSAVAWVAVGNAPAEKEVFQEVALSSLGNSHEGSIPFNRSIDFKALTKKCK